MTAEARTAARDPVSWRAGLPRDGSLSVPFWRRLFWQMYLAQLAVLGVITLSTGLYVWGMLQRQFDQVVEQDLQRSMQLMALTLEPVLDRPEALSRTLQRLVDRTDVRATLMDRNGRVVADSAAVDDVSRLLPHGGRPEFRQALAEGQGRGHRVSETVGIPMVYLARRMELSGETHVLRVALPWAQFSQRLSWLRWAWAAVILVAAAVGAVLTLWVSGRIAHPVARLSEAVDRMAEGRFDQEVPSVPGGELAALREGVTRLQRQLSDKLLQLEDEKNLLQTIVSAMAEGLIVVDATGRVILVNPMGLHLLGVQDVWNPRSVESRLLIEVTRNPLLIELIENAIRSGEAQREDVESRRGLRRLLKVSVAPLKEDEAVRGAVAVLHDHTQIRQLERVRRDFVANVSHELRTPIAAIQGWAETLTSGIVEMPEFVEEQLLVILRHARRLSALVDDLLALARVEALGIEDAFVPVRVRDLVDDLLEGLAEQVEQKGMGVEVRVDASCEVIRSEPRALEYVCRNLLENAIKYTPAGGRVLLEVHALAGQVLELVVEDNGTGIEEQHLPRLFERFYRIDRGRSRDVGGTGLGLSIVKHFAEALGGTVGVQSEPGQGSRFWVRLPSSVWQVDGTTQASA